MEIKFEQSATKGSFYIETDGERLAEMTFSRAGESLIIIDHTEVSDKLKGKGAGKQLVAAAVAHAREQKIKILPLCTFAKSVFDKVEEYRDVLS
jgi:predicted GNAT family acetyltransferase